MTLIDAVKSGKKINRKDKTYIKYLFESDNQQAYLSKADILATDWEIEPEVYEFECQIKDLVSIIPRDKPPQPLGKKCRVRVEVIGD